MKLYETYGSLPPVDYLGDTIYCVDHWLVMWYTPEDSSDEYGLVEAMTGEGVYSALYWDYYRLDRLQIMGQFHHYLLEEI